ncbi:MAG TPA: hypothetical protein VD767_08150 [Thermomicrobiales bacterium]|nr:hypothetical protein [Thermomicrobiales bacterium]
MMQRTVGMYIANRIKDELLKPPTVVEDEVDDEGQEIYEDPLDGEVIRNEAGETLGVAHRLANVAVYVVGNRGVNANVEMERALDDPETEIVIHREGRKITALVYIPSVVARAPQSATHGFRADDV